MSTNKKEYFKKSSKQVNTTINGDKQTDEVNLALIERHFMLSNSNGF